MSRRYIMRVELTPKAVKQLATTADRQGMTQLSMLSRAVCWLANQPEQIQSAVLGHYPNLDDEAVARLVLTRMNGQTEGVRQLLMSEPAAAPVAR